MLLSAGVMDEMEMTYVTCTSHIGHEMELTYVACTSHISQFHLIHDTSQQQQSGAPDEVRKHRPKHIQLTRNK